MDCPKAIALGVACTLFPTAQGERHYIATNRNILAQLGSPMPDLQTNLRASGGEPLSMTQLAFETDAEK